jgi:hypothetical protein
MATSGWQQPNVTHENVVAKATFFVDAQLWPVEAQLNVSGWMSNFLPDERDYAVHLLNAFIYVSQPLMNKVFEAAIANLSRTIVTSKKNLVRARSEWGRFLSSALFVRVTGEKPHDADSGFIFARMARNVLNIPEERILPPTEALLHLARDPSVPIVFVDDFVGSGLQFSTLWRRPSVRTNGQPLSFASLAALAPDLRAYYTPLIATASGVQNVKQSCPSVYLVPAHVLDDRYSAVSPTSIVWPDHLRAGASDFLLSASTRAGIPDTDGGENDWRGFHKLALTLSFEHGPPDATLPIFYWSQNNWTPLVRRYGS